MSPDASNIIASVMRSLDPNRSLSASSRASEIAQGQVAIEAVDKVNQKRTSAPDAISKNKIRHEHEYKRRHYERRNNPSPDQEEDNGDGSHIDVVV